LVLNKHIKTAIVEADFKHSLENYYIENISHEVRNLLGTQRLAILINNVGVVREGPFEDIS
jgi:short-subunit dehydrogenase